MRGSTGAVMPAGGTAMVLIDGEWAVSVVRDDGCGGDDGDAVNVVVSVGVGDGGDCDDGVAVADDAEWGKEKPGFTLARLVGGGGTKAAGSAEGVGAEAVVCALRDLRRATSDAMEPSRDASPRRRTCRGNGARPTCGDRGSSVAKRGGIGVTSSDS